MLDVFSTWCREICHGCDVSTVALLWSAWSTMIALFSIYRSTISRVWVPSRKPRILACTCIEVSRFGTTHAEFFMEFVPILLESARYRCRSRTEASHSEKCAFSIPDIFGSSSTPEVFRRHAKQGQRDWSCVSHYCAMSEETRECKSWYFFYSGCDERVDSENASCCENAYHESLPSIISSEASFGSFNGNQSSFNCKGHES